MPILMRHLQMSVRMAGAVHVCPYWCFVFCVVVVSFYRMCCLAFPPHVICSCSASSGLSCLIGCLLLSWCLIPLVCVVHPSLSCSVLEFFYGWQILSENAGFAQPVLCRQFVSSIHVPRPWVLGNRVTWRVYFR